MHTDYMTKINIKPRILISVVLMFFMLTTLCFAAESRSLRVNSETEIEMTVHKAKGNTLFLWLYSEAGPQQAEEQIADELARQGIEVWRVDLFAAHFLPVASSSMDRIPDTDFSFLIETAHKETGKKIIPVTIGRGSLPVLAGARHWQQKHKDQRALSGVILMSPKFYTETPDPGEEAKLLPVVEQTNLPVFILQPKKSPWYWKLEHTIPALEKSGSDVLVKRLKDVRDRYFFRQDADEVETKLTDKLPEDLVRAANYLNALPYKQRQVTNNKVADTKIATSKKERSLKPYRGDPKPPELILNDLSGKTYDLKNLQGKVILVNFWASWCPPCVHEMPSMQQLQNRFKPETFTILGVNMAEDADTIRSFLNTKVSVNFPIIMDTDGAALKRWQVFAFPTSYVIDKKGRIRYALFGGVDWETPDILHKISKLISE